MGGWIHLGSGESCNEEDCCALFVCYHLYRRDEGSFGSREMRNRRGREKDKEDGDVIEEERRGTKGNILIPLTHRAYLDSMPIKLTKN